MKILYLVVYEFWEGTEGFLDVVGCTRQREETIVRLNYIGRVYKVRLTYPDQQRGVCGVPQG